MNNYDFNVGTIDPSSCISNAWQAIKPNYWLFFGMTIVVMTLLVCLACIPIIGFVLAGPLSCGIYFVALRQLRGEDVDFGMIFKGFEVFVAAMIAGLIISIPYLVNQILELGTAFAVLGAAMSGNEAAIESASAANVGVSLFKLGLFAVGIVFSVLFFFAYPLVVDKKLSGLEAIKLSSAAARKNLAGIIVLILLESLIMIAGALALCIGIFFVLPVIFAANAEAYRQIFPDDAAPAPRNNMPPMPYEYRDLDSNG